MKTNATLPAPRVTFCGPAEDRRARLFPLFHAIKGALRAHAFATGRAGLDAGVGWGRIKKSLAPDQVRGDG